MLAALTEFNRFSQAAESNQYIPCSITLEETGGVPSTTTNARVKDPGIIFGVGRGGGGGVQSKLWSNGSRGVVLPFAEVAKITLQHGSSSSTLTLRPDLTVLLRH